MNVDIVAQDRSRRDVLLVEVRPRALTPDIVSEYFSMMEAASPSTPFAMVIDPETIYLKRFGHQGLEPRMVELKTLEVLRHYDPELGEGRTPPWYRTSLVGTWLRDFAFRWRKEAPPGVEQLTDIGLVDRLEDAEILREVEFESDSVR